MSNLRGFAEGKSEAKVSEPHSRLVSTLKEIVGELKLIRALRRKDLNELGLKIIREEGEDDCPLCDTEWGEGELEALLKEKIASAEKAQNISERIEKETSILLEIAQTVRVNLEKVEKGIKRFEASAEQVQILAAWKEDITIYISILEAPIDKYDESVLIDQETRTLFAPREAIKLIEFLEQKIKESIPVVSPEEEALVSLTHLKIPLERVRKAELSLEAAKQIDKRARILYREFEKARNEILDALYESVKNRFEGLYRDLHNEDESDFKAKFEHEGSSFNVEVDFYGRGSHPPHALHSEGHQDSMGICLFLSLSEYLTKNLIDIVLLDDVVMSVDEGHRRHLCSVLSQQFPHKQFLITTHDKTWAYQLKSEGVVSSKNLIEFNRWSIETGPRINYETDLWERIDRAVENNDIPEAAWLLRRGMEEFFENVCDSLKGRIQYRQDKNWSLGDFLPAAYRSYMDMLNKAKKVAQSWEKKEVVERIEELESIAKQIYQKTEAELWGVNSSVHYNEWANLGKQDFIPIRHAFFEMQNLFLCQECGTRLQITEKGLKAQSATCSCSEYRFNLVHKKDTQSMLATNMVDEPSAEK